MGAEEAWEEDAIAAALQASKGIVEAGGLEGGVAPSKAPSGDAIAPSGRFADQWRARELIRESEAAQQEAEARRQRAAACNKARYRLSKALHGARYVEAVGAAEEVLDAGESLPNDLLCQLLQAVSDVPDPKLFAQVVRACSRGGIRLDEHGFASLVGRLLAREAPHAQVRCALNFGIRADADVLPLEPIDGRKEEQKDCYKGMEVDDGLQAELSEGEMTGRPGDRAPRILEMRGCMNEKLNGYYARRLANKELLGHSLPIYERRNGPKEKYFVYFWDESFSEEKDPEFKTGWYICSEVGPEGQTFAHHPCKAGSAPIPPAAGLWRIKRHANWKADYPLFTPALRPDTKTKSQEEVEHALALVDLSKLRGSVHGKDPETCTYFTHFFVLLTLEHLAELRGFRSRWGFRSVKELVSFGLCFDRIRAEEVSPIREDADRTTLPGWPAAGSQRVAFRLPWDATEHKCRFKASENVIISRGDPVQNRVCEGTVQTIDFVDRRITITLNGHLPDDDALGRLFYRIDSYANRTTYERQVIALLDFITKKRTKMCEMLVTAEVGLVDLAVLGGDGFAKGKDQLGGRSHKDAGEPGKLSATQAKADEALRHWDDDDWFLGELKKANVESVRTSAPKGMASQERKERLLKLASDDVEGVDKERLEVAKAQAASMESVSATQKDAIASAMSKRLTIVQGPPGTGKTHTSVRIVTMWVKTMNYKPLLVTSECNIAVDNIAIGLMKNGVKVVRMGNEAKVRHELAPACLGNLIKKRRKEMKEEKDEESEELEEVGEEPWDDNRAWAEWDRRRTKRRRKLIWEAKQDKWCREKILKEAEVIAATTINSGSVQLGDVKFYGILIDEVAQATETSSIVPIVCRGGEKETQLVLCGDHCQLPPSVQSREAELRGYSLSLYSRLVEAGVPFRFLDTQFRAHPMLMEFSAACIYQGRLKHGIDGSLRRQVAGIPWPSKECPAAFFESSVEEHLEGESKANSAEADVVCELVQGVLDAGELDTSEIGVVTPYKGQVRVLRRVLRAGLKASEQALDGLEVASVDNFQGREKEIIIFSAVRCNDYGGVGFLKDWRRLNVMITRARRGLVVIGNAVTLCHDPHWKLWLEFTEKQGGTPKGTVEKALLAVSAQEGAKGKGKRAKGGKGAGESPEKKARAEAASSH